MMHLDILLDCIVQLCQQRKGNLKTTYSMSGFQYPIHYTTDDHKPLERQRVHRDPKV